MVSHAHARLLILSLASLLGAAQTAAHPHVTIKVETAVVVHSGKATSFLHRWTFDKAYLTSILEEYDADRNGRIEGAELTKLVAETDTTLKLFHAFTVARHGKRKLKLRSATDIQMSFEEGIPVLRFAINLARPVSLADRSFRFEVYDATYFSAFAFATPAAVTFSGTAPVGCTLKMEQPAAKGDQMAAYRAFASEFGPAAAKLVTPTLVVADCAGNAQTTAQPVSTGNTGKP